MLFFRYQSVEESGQQHTFSNLHSQWSITSKFFLKCRRIEIWWLVIKFFLCLGTVLVSPLLVCPLIVDSWKHKSVSYIFGAFSAKLKEFVSLALLVVSIIFLNATFAMSFFPQRFSSPENQCSSFFQCTIYFVTNGLQGGGISDLISDEETSTPNYNFFLSADLFANFIRVIWILIYFIAVPTCLISVVTGVIIESFGTIRAERENRAQLLQDSCFICGTPAFEWKRSPKDTSLQRSTFGDHVHTEHNIRDYLFLYFRLKEFKSLGTLTHTEREIVHKLEVFDTSFFPNIALGLASSPSVSGAEIL